ncbi:MAG: sensor histidine kinase [Rariglobus sp.]
MGDFKTLSAGIMRRLGWGLLMILAGFSKLWAQQVVSVLPEVERLDLVPYIVAFRDPSGEMGLADVRASGALFSPVEEGRPSFGFTADAVWLKVALRGDLPATARYMVELNCARLGEVDWHVVSADGRVLYVEQTGIVRPRNPRSPMTRTPVLAVTLAPGEVIEVFVRVRSQTALILPLTLWAPDELTGTNSRGALVDGLFFGYLAAMGIVAIGMALMTKERGFLIYALMMPNVGGLYFFAGGYPSWYGWPSPTVWERDGVVALHGLGWFLGVLFVRYFFDLATRAPALDRWARGALWVCAGLVVASPLAPYRPMIVMFLSCELAVGVGAVAACFYFWRWAGFRGGRMLMAGLLSCYLVSIISILQYLRIIPVVIRTEILALGVICMGTGFFMVALGMRVREIRRENERNQRQALEVQEEINRRLEAEVRERTAELRQAKESAEEANRFKGLFLANISHEVRAPISTLVGLSQALWMQSEKQGLTEEFRRFLNQIRSGGQYLNLILTNLLDITAAEAGNTPLHWSRVRVQEWFGSVKDLLDPIAMNHGIRLEWTIQADGDASLDTDPVRLTQILLNIVHNAIKFTPRGRRVEVVIRVVGERFELEVTDEGPGIPTKDLALIFEAFRQSESTANGSERGVGLGLSVVKTNTDLLGGIIQVVNREEGGACFTLILPLQRSLLRP